MPYEVPPLPYDYDALEPHIDEQTMRLHHDKHHQAYVDNANKALAGTEWENRPVENVLANLEILPEDIKTAVRNNAGGHANHSLFWEIMSPDGGGEPSGSLAEAIATTFGSVDELKKDLIDTGVKRFGSGWSWLVYDGTALSVYSTANQDSPITQLGRPAARHRRVGARLLPEVPEPQARISRDLVERRQLGRRSEEVRERGQVVRALSVRQCLTTGCVPLHESM